MPTASAHKLSTAGHSAEVLVPQINVEELPDLLKTVNLSQAEFDKIVDGLGRWPNKNELAMFSVLWSEHCCYKHSKHLLKTLPTEGERILQGPGENAGVVSIGNDIGVAFKIESHNHPTAVEPFQGAATGVGGILRDIFTMNARPVANLNALRFGPLSAVGGVDEPTAARNRYLLSGAVEGIAHYGNCVGVPTVGGEVFFDPCFSGNPLVNAMAVGLVYGDTLMPSGAKGVGNPVVYVGSDTGKDGMGGAAFASKELDAEAGDDDRPAVQVGDPFLEKLLIEACLEAFATGYIVAAQDMGAAGLTCSGAEMSAKGGENGDLIGMKINLDAVPAREPGMLPHEFLQSESQERMLFVIEAGKEAEIMAIFHKWGLNAAVVGEVIGERRLVFTMADDTGSETVVADVPPALLTEDAPLYEATLTPEEPGTLKQRRQQLWDEANVPDLTGNEINDWLQTLLASPNIARPTPVFHQYDRHVRNNTTLASEVNTAGVIRVRDSEGKPTGQGLALTTDGLSPYVMLNPREGAKTTVAEAARNLACVGAVPLAVTNNLNFGHPEKPETYYHLAESVAGMGEACRAFNTPVTGGNVSLYNERGGRDGAVEAILPSPVIGMVGLLDDASMALGSSINQPGDTLLLLGQFAPSLGGSQYQVSRCGQYAGEPPAVDLTLEANLQQLLPKLAQQQLLTAAHDVSLGGLLVTLTEMLTPAALQSSTESPTLGMNVSLSALPAQQRLDVLLFGETAGSIVVCCPSAHVEAVTEQANALGVTVTPLGEVTDQPQLSLTLPDNQTVALQIPKLIETYTTSFSNQLTPTL